jgi:hypothetical protein
MIKKTCIVLWMMRKITSSENAVLEKAYNTYVFARRRNRSNSAIVYCGAIEWVPRVSRILCIGLKGFRLDGRFKYIDTVILKVANFIIGEEYFRHNSYVKKRKRAEWYHKIRSWDGIPLLIGGQYGLTYGVRTVFERSTLFGWPSTRYYARRVNLLAQVNVPWQIEHLLIGKARHMMIFIENNKRTYKQAEQLLRVYIERYDLDKKQWQ